MSLLKAERIPGKHSLIKALLVFLSVVFFLNPTLFASQHIKRKKVLVLFGFRPTLPVASQWDRGIRSVFEASTSPKTVINIEYLDLTHVYDDIYTRLLLDTYRYKYSNPKPDIIIPVFKGAVDLMLKHGPDFFPGVPIVFGGVESKFVESRSLEPNITGHLTYNNYSGTLEVAIALHPDTKHITIISGAGPIGRGWSKACREAYREYEDRFKFNYLIGLPLDVLLEKVANLPAQTVVIALPILKDSVGSKFVFNEVLSQITRASNAPVFTFWDVCLGTGIVGGYMSNFEEEGKVVAKLALRILNGEKPADIPVTQASKFSYMFDWNQLKRWSISENRLPQGSIVRYKKLSVWEEYKKTFVGAMAIILAQTLALTVMFIQRKRRRLAEKALRISEERYEFAVAGSRDGLWDWNLLSNTVFYSDRFKELLNYASDDFSDTIDSFRSLLHPEDADAAWAAVDRHLKERVPFNVEYRLQTKSGEYRWFLARGQAVWDRKGLPLRMAGSISDVNARKQAEADITERLFFENMISELSTEFIRLSADETDNKFNFALSRIGTFMNVDRCFLFQFNWEKTKFRISNLWGGEGVQKDEMVLDAHVKDVFPWLYQNLLIGKDIVISDVEELSDQEEVREEYEYCRQIGIQSFIIIPIQVLDAPLCAIGLDSINNKRTWSEENIIRLRIMGEVFANTIGRKHSEKGLLESYNEINKLKDKLLAERDYLQEEIKIAHNHENIIGDSESLKYVLYKLEQAATIDSTVIILGETGTGKELVARAIHRTSLRHQHSLIKVNCAALPMNLIESELFGHEKGAFTGATAQKIGRFELANNATLFLDEIGELPLELQAKMLRSIEEGEFERLGGSKTIKVNVRIIAATNRNLKKAMKEGRFREDLWYRLNVYPITMPPLRERKEDIPLLVSYFVDQYNRQLGKSIEKIPVSVIQTLQGYSWPGNIRELKHVVERAVISSSEPTLRLADSLESPPDKTVQEKDDLKPMAEMECEYILRVLDKVGWKVEGKSGAAEVLDMNPGTLRSRMKKLDIRRPKVR